MQADYSTAGRPAIGSVVAGPGPGGGRGMLSAGGFSSSMSYHEHGKRLFVAFGQDARLQIIDCLSGKADRPAYRLERDKIRLVEAT